MKLTITIFILSIQGFVYGQNSADEVKQKLEGWWDWIKSEIVDRSGGGTITTFTCECSLNLHFSENGIVSIYNNDTLSSSEKYSLEEVYFMQDPVKIMVRSSSINDQIMMYPDSILMGSFGMCGVIQYFKKN